MLFGVLIIIAVYLPIFTLEGLEGKMFRPMAITVCSAILGSLFLSLTVVPVLASLLLKPGPEHQPWLMRHAHLILTDSGGVQEEAPFMGKPVLVMRDVTERPEAVAAGTVKLVGTDAAKIVTESCRLLDDSDAYMRMSQAPNPFGDGRAGERIVREIVNAHA